MVSFSEEFKKIRKNKGLTIAQLAELSGITEATIRNIERGVTSPSYKTIHKLAIALDCDWEFLYSITEK